MFLKIKPCDTTFFRDGKPFDLFSNNFIYSKTVPYSSVFFGALFTSLLAKHDTFRKEFFQRNLNDHKEILKIENIFIMNDNNDIYIKAPLDLFVDNNKKDKTYIGEFEKYDVIDSSMPFERILITPNNGKCERVSKYYIDIYDFMNYYKREKTEFITLINEANIFCKNVKNGIAIDNNSRMVEEGKLYYIEQNEFINNKWSFLIQCSVHKKGYTIPDIPFISGYLKLGGENKAAEFSLVNSDEIEHLHEFCQLTPKDEYNKGDIIKAVLTKEWYSYKKLNADKDFIEGLKLVGMSNDAPEYIGGYDIKNKISKCMYRGYSVGTVLLFECQEYITGKDAMEKLKNIFSLPDESDRCFTII